MGRVGVRPGVDGFTGAGTGTGTGRGFTGFTGAGTLLAGGRGLHAAELLKGAGALAGQKSPWHAKEAPGVISASGGRLKLAPRHVSAAPLHHTEPAPLPKLKLALPLHASGPWHTTVRSRPTSPFTVMPPS